MKFKIKKDIDGATYLVKQETDKSNIITEPLTNGDNVQAMRVVWQALHALRDTQLPEGITKNDEQWDDICTAMSWIDETLEKLSL